MNPIDITHIDGDLAVGRHVSMGGDLNVAGDVAIGHNLRVGGVIDADNLRGANKGIFLTVEELEETYPNPTNGWYAGVGTTSPFDAYIGKDGAWVATGGTIYGENEGGGGIIDDDYDFIANVVKTEGNKYYLRKDKPDTAAGKETFNGGIAVNGKSELNGDTSIEGNATVSKDTALRGALSVGGRSNLRTTYFGDYQPGLIAGASSGALINESGDAKFKSVSISEFLEVPEFRYNRALVTIGIGLRSEGGGIIETVTPTVIGGVRQLTGTATLKLEDGEYGAIMPGDLLLGFWHNEDGGNADETTDSRNGDYTLAGFTAVYFEVVQVFGSNNGTFTYYLRSATDSQWTSTAHPFAGMHFASIGHRYNSHPTRQQLKVETPTYTLRLTGLNDWNYTSSNIYEIHGLLDGFSMQQVGDDGEIYTKEFTGYGQVLGNAYVFGTIERFERAKPRMEIDTGGEVFLDFGESLTATCTVYRGWEDVTSQVKRWLVSRDSGDPADDAAWLLRSKVKNFAGQIELFSNKDPNIDDLGSIDNHTTEFTFTAYLDNSVASLKLVI